MNQESSFLLQKQVRDNSEDWQKELLDLNNWEKEMKRKEEELLSSNEQIKFVPPVRSKKKKIIKTSPPVASTSKASDPERIKSYDYNAWDQFDVDSACRKLDEENASDEEVEDIRDNAQKKHSQAVNLKEQGNSFVKNKMYDKAVKCYSEAIRLFPYDEVFYANRALCYLKQNSLHSAEADCTAALQLNENYVKAYHRRATARIELEDYQAAKQDINCILRLEPSNKEAKHMLSKVTKKLEKSNKIGQEFCNTSKLKEQIQIHKQQMVEVKKMKEQTKSIKMKITEVGNEDEIFEKKLPNWLPKLDENYSIVQPVELSPHQRSKKPMKRVQIETVDFGNNILPKSCEKHIEVDKKESKPIKQENCVKKEQITEIKKEPVKKTAHEKILEEIKCPETPKIIEIIKKEPENTEDNKQIRTKESDKEIKKRPLIEVITTSEDIPPAPKTSVQFFTDWKRNKTLDFRYSYLKQIAPNTMPALFKESMESNVLDEIIIIMKEKFVPNKDNIYEYLKELSNVQRFRTLVMFIERKTKEALKELFEYCRKIEGKSGQDIDALCQKYEL